MASALLGIDIGATKITAGLLLPNGQVVLRHTLLTEMHKGKNAVIENLLAAISTYPRASYQRIGIGIIGSVDWRRGISHPADNLPPQWHNVPLARIVSRKFHKRVALGNDANAFALGVALRDGKRYHTVVGLTLGSGVGAGLVIGRKLYHGDQGWVAEIGHTTIDASSTVRCSCGHRGHLDVLAGGWGMVRMYAQKSGKQRSTYEIQERLPYDRSAKYIYRVMVRSLGIGLANIIAVYGPSYIGVGGGLTRIPGLIRDGIKEMHSRRRGLPVTRTSVKRINDPEETNIRGAALLTDPIHHLTF